MLKNAIERLVDRYVMIGGMAEASPAVQTDNYNPHDERIETEHSYAASEVSTGHAPPQKRRRVLPQ